MSKKKMIAPVFITIILILYMMMYVAVCILLEIPAIIKLIGFIILAAIIGTLIFVLVERIKEIKSGEEDDLDKY